MVAHPAIRSWLSGERPAGGRPGGSGPRPPVRRPHQARFDGVQADDELGDSRAGAHVRAHVPRDCWVAAGARYRSGDRAAATSYNAMPAATPAFSDSVRAAIGILTSTESL